MEPRTDGVDQLSLTKVSDCADHEPEAERIAHRLTMCGELKRRRAGAGTWSDKPPLESVFCPAVPDGQDRPLSRLRRVAVNPEILPCGQAVPVSRVHVADDNADLGLDTVA